MSRHARPNCDEAMALLLDTNVVSELRKVAAGKADERFAAWSRQQTLFSHRDNLDKRPPENRESSAFGPDQAEKPKSGLTGGRRPYMSGNKRLR